MEAKPSRGAPRAVVVAPRARPLQNVFPELELVSHGERCEALAPGTPIRVLRELKQAKHKPELTLDVHGLNRVQAVSAVDALLTSALDSGLRTLLIVHGRGVHSGVEGPVLQSAITQYLVQARSGSILALASAPAQWGGPGATLVRLRRSDRGRAG